MGLLYALSKMFKNTPSDELEGETTNIEEIDLSEYLAGKRFTVEELDIDTLTVVQGNVEARLKQVKQPINEEGKKVPPPIARVEKKVKATRTKEVSKQRKVGELDK